MIYVNDCVAETDSKTIQSAVNKAHQSGDNTVCITAFNARSKKYGWEIDETILLPDNITVILENCRMIMADGVFCNMFANSLAYEPEGLALAGEQHGINIIGVGKPVLDGGNYNNCSEWSKDEYVRTNLKRNCMVLLHNVRDFRVSGFKVRHQRYWATCFTYCRFGEIKDLEFEADLSSADENGVHYPDRIPKEYPEVYIKNGDGVDLRVGCNNILVENISGFTEDDSVAMTALKGPEDREHVEGKSFDIHHITVRNIRTYIWRWAAQVRILNHDGIKIHDISVDGIMDTSDPSNEFRNGSAVLISDPGTEYIKERPVVAGELYNISVQNVFSRAGSAVRMYGPVECVTLHNIHTMYGTNAAVSCETDVCFKNVDIDGVFCPAESDIDAIFDFNRLSGTLNVRNVYCESANYVMRNTASGEIKAENVNVSKLRSGNKDTEFVMGHIKM